MAVETVIGRIGGNLIKRLVDLIKQAWQNRPIMHIIQCQLMGNDFPRCLINTQMQLSPDTALVNTVSADLPLPFTKYFQPGAVDYQMQGAGLIIALQTLIGNLHSLNSQTKCNTGMLRSCYGQGQTPSSRHKAHKIASS